MDAKLYEVQTVRGIVYALHQISTGLVWTERSETAARQLARDKKLNIISEEVLSHQDLLRLIGHEPVTKPAASADKVEAPVEQPKDVELQSLSSGARVGDFIVSSPPPSTLPFPVRYHLDDEPDQPADDALLIAREPAKPPKSIFCSDGEIAPKLPPESL